MEKQRRDGSISNDDRARLAAAEKEERGVRPSAFSDRSRGQVRGGARGPSWVERQEGVRPAREAQDYPDWAKGLLKAPPDASDAPADAPSDAPPPWARARDAASAGGAPPRFTVRRRAEVEGDAEAEAESFGWAAGGRPVRDAAGRGWDGPGRGGGDGGWSRPGGRFDGGPQRRDGGGRFRGDGERPGPGRWADGGRERAGRGGVEDDEDDEPYGPRPDPLQHIGPAGVAADGPLPAGWGRFAGVPVPGPALEALARMGVAAAAPVQEAGAGAVYRGDSCLLHAPTGSGKTLAFLLPVAARFAAGPGRAGPVRGLVLVPTRELALQVGGWG